MAELFIFILACYGLSNMVVYSKGPLNIFENFRNKVSLISSNLGELFSCMMCFPFWAGVIISVLDIILINVTFTPFNMLFNGQTVDFVTIVVILVMDGIISSGTTWILHNIEEYFEQ